MKKQVVFAAVLISSLILAVFSYSSATEKDYIGIWRGKVTSTIVEDGDKQIIDEELELTISHDLGGNMKFESESFPIKAKMMADALIVQIILSPEEMEMYECEDMQLFCDTELSPDLNSLKLTCKSSQGCAVSMAISGLLTK